MTRLYQPARYLLRVDDLCPTTNAERWLEVQEWIFEAGIRAILAVVPANRDPELAVSAPDPHFWTNMRRLEAAGATIGLHGFRHSCTQRGRSLVPVHRHTEFAGAAIEEQYKWIAAGLAILRSYGLTPKLWVAPRHGFDRNTLRALHLAGMNYLSDGLGRMPVRRDGVLWIPQQLWGPATKTEGLWTICIHPNTMTAADCGELRAFLRENGMRFTTFDSVIQDSPHAAPSLMECGREAWMTARAVLKAGRLLRGHPDKVGGADATAPARRQRPAV